jgi:hypothetical protein
MRSCVFLAVLLAGAICASVASDSRAAAQTPTPGPEAVLVGAGDIASCTNPGDEQTGELLTLIPGTVATFGDDAYESGTAAEFTSCYDPNWGIQKSRTKPSAGNHEYNTSGATGYYNYFGAAAGDPTRGYYSYDLGAWHVVVLNSNCAAIGGCDAASPQVQWLRADLSAHPATCTLAYWHHPRFSSGQHGNNATFQPFWQALYDYGADLVLVGHDHDYERFALQNPAGSADPQHGIREFVVGTGGRSHYAMGAPIANSEVQNGDTYGVIKLTLHPTSYDWQFIHVFGATFTDSGSGACVSAASPPPVGGLTSLSGEGPAGSHSTRLLGVVAGVLLTASIAAAAYARALRSRS